MFLLALAAAAATPAAPDPDYIAPVREAELSIGAITVTASREPVFADLSGVAISIVDASTIAALRLPLVTDYLRLTPSVAVATSGPLGGQTQVRIRGAEGNHTLIFVDGIKLNDSASSGEFRFETLLAGGVDRIEVLRGPQSALWGAEAIGGVVNVLTRLPTRGTEFYGEAEAGSFGRVRVGGGGGWGAADGSRAIGLQAVHLDQDGIDTSGSGGDRDGYRNTTVSGQAALRPSADTRLNLSGRWSDAHSRFDDFDFAAGVALDAPLATSARSLALRGAAGVDLLGDRWSHDVSLAWTDTANVNRTAGAFTNRSDGNRLVADYQTSLDFLTGDASHRVTLAGEYERQRFVSRDLDGQALSNQRRSRRKASLIGEYRLELGSNIAAGLSLRHDDNNRFRNATTVRATAAASLDSGLRLHASYGEGVADPTFFDLFGFFPDFFVGNPDLEPERSKGFDAGIGYARDGLALDFTYHRARLVDEIVGTFDSVTFLSGVENAVGRSRRQGIEATAEATLAPGLRLLASYAWLDAGERAVRDGAALREVRRPEHSGSLTLGYVRAPFNLAASVAYVGERRDTDFATFSRVTLNDYALVTLSAAWEFRPGFELTGRLENAADARYRDVVGFRTQGIGAYAGVRAKL